MVRRQIQLTEKQDASVRRAARRQKTTVAAFVREAVDLALRRDDDGVRLRRALAAVGRFGSGKRDLAQEHDRYLAELDGR